MKAAGYIRVSSEMQIETGHSLDAQRFMIKEYVRSKGWMLSEVFCDPGLSGSLSNRPALQELMARAEQHEFDVVIVHAIDRFYRDLGGLLAALHRLQQHHISFVSITENLDFTTVLDKNPIRIEICTKSHPVYNPLVNFDSSSGDPSTCPTFPTDSARSSSVSSQLSNKFFSRSPNPLITRLCSIPSQTSRVAKPISSLKMPYSANNSSFFNAK